jgi:hypothetical protein
VLDDIATPRARRARDLLRRRQHHARRRRFERSARRSSTPGCTTSTTRAGDDGADCAHGDDAGAADARAGFRYVFLGIENVLDDDLGFLKARRRTAEREADAAERDACGVDVLHGTACSSSAA